MSPLDRLLGRTVVIVAHPDDECIAFGALLQRIKHPTVVYCTDGAPFDPYFWKERYGSREKYTDLRQQEARRALQAVGVKDAVFLADRRESQGLLADQELYRAIPIAHELLRDLIKVKKAEALLTLAYEGGHPDHDTCNFLTSLLAAEFKIPAFEAPLYTRAGWSGEGRNPRGLQRFIGDSNDAIDVAPTADELARKRTMCAQYPSQGDFLRIFDIRREILRPLPQHDYSQPPHQGVLNYEAWQWKMNGRDVSAAIVDFRKALAQRAI